MMVMVPSSMALNRLIPDLKHGIPDPLVEDIPLLRHIVSNHLIIREGVVPAKIFSKLQEFHEIIKVNMRGKNIVFHREETKGGGSKYLISCF